MQYPGKVEFWLRGNFLEHDSLWLSALRNPCIPGVNWMTSLVSINLMGAVAVRNLRTDAHNGEMMKSSRLWSSCLKYLV